MKLAERTFPQEPEAVAGSRDFARRLMGEWGVPGDSAGDAALVVDELAANAVRHARSAFRLRLSLDDTDVLLIEVTDDAPDWPVIVPPLERHSGGRGVAIVEALAETWGVRDRPEGGKTVWASIPTRPPAQSQTPAPAPGPAG